MLDITQIISDYGPWAIFVLVLIEDFGIPVPGETALISAALLASQGKMPIELLLPAAWLGAVIGDNIGYAIGRFGGRRVVLRHGARVGITEARLARIERFFQRRGGAIVIVARFFVGLRQLNGIVAGIGCMAAPRFALYNAIGAALWVGAWGFGTYWFGKHFEQALAHFGPVGLYTAAGVTTVVVLIYLVWRFVYRSRPQGSNNS
ncbi:DedA family protein [Salinisphaera sp. LB1]|uniref:DedA family protein n=1 Tax=Salinisphaera sp. LB1 TaxID=2183911 RepID=UPI000D706A23|nr:DedA family protein [Salinisphaera sp. LB1]AWN15612.1 DedA family protein [Salinisphaera sp. LB1]